MGPKKDVQYQGKQVTGQAVEFDAKAESWNQYVLEDGSILKLKIVLLDVVRLDTYNEIGDPIYQFSAQQLVVAQVPPNLKKRDQ